MARRAVITGTGVICSLGLSTSEFWSNCLEGVSRVASIPEAWREYSKFRSTVWSPLPEIDFSDRNIGQTERLQFDTVTLLALGAAYEAFDNAGLTLALEDKRAKTYSVDVDSNRAGVFIGTGIGGAESFVTNYANQMLVRPSEDISRIAQSVGESQEIATELKAVQAKLRYPPRFNPFVVSRLMPNATAAALGIKFSFRGPNATSALACASGTAAIGQAFRAVRSGEADIALAGGCEYLRDPYGGIFRGFDAARTLVYDRDDPSRANRPFDKARSGFLFSEGAACVLVIEELEHAQSRGATPIAEIAGLGHSFDAYNMMSPAPDGLQIKNMIQSALSDANMSTHDIQYINAHGTGTESNDGLEAAIIEEIFGSRVRVNSTKSLLGHTIGASGALEALVSALSLDSQQLHESLNLDDPVNDIDFVRSSTDADLDGVLTHSFAFGGHNAALVLRRFER
jgi:3-oxoacyl-[acyl-carrier-protein] synthase II